MLVDEQKHVYESDTIAMPSIRQVLGEIPNPDPVRRHKEQPRRKPVNREMVLTIRRIIAYIENME